MEVPFFVAFAAILLVGKFLPLNLRLALLADNAGRQPACAAKCAISVAVGGLTLLVSMPQQGAGAGGPAGVATMMETRVLWFNSAALFLGMLLVVIAVALHPQAQRRRPIVDVAVEHLTWFTETIAITAFTHNVCIFFKVVEMIQK